MQALLYVEATPHADRRRARARGGPRWPLSVRPDDDEADDGIVAEINITPLTDVFLVLLIIFMVTSSVIANTGKKVDLPEAVQQSQTPPKAVNVTITEAGAVQVNDQVVKLEQLRAHLEKALAGHRQQDGDPARRPQGRARAGGLRARPGAARRAPKGFALATKKPKKKLARAGAPLARATRSATAPRRGRGEEQQLRQQQAHALEHREGVLERERAAGGAR